MAHKLTFLSSPPVTITRADFWPNARHVTLAPWATNSSATSHQRQDEKKCQVEHGTSTWYILRCMTGRGWVSDGQWGSATVAGNHLSLVRWAPGEWMVNGWWMVGAHDRPALCTIGDCPRPITSGLIASRDPTFTMQYYINTTGILQYNIQWALPV